MGLIGSSLQIGLSAIHTYQSVLEVVGNNVANAGNPDYTRQSASLSAVPGSPIAQGLMPGAGVAMTALQRHIDESLENRIRAAIGEEQAASVHGQQLARVESFFNELTGAGLSTQLTAFFNAMSEVQNTPTDLAIRDVAIAAGSTLAGALRRTREDLGALADEIDDQIGAMIGQVDEIAGRIAELNAEIASAEAGRSGAAGALRDQRDALLRSLSELVDVTVRHQQNGAVNVYIGSEALVQGGVARSLTAGARTDGIFSRTHLRFADTNSEIAVTGGRLGGLIASRDADAIGRIDSIDQLAAAIIFEVNLVHADGQGLVGFSSLTSANAVVDPTAALNGAAAGLPFSPGNGSFFIAVTDDATGTTTGYQIEVDLDGSGDDTTLESMAASINDTVAGVTAQITPDNRLELLAGGGLTFTFGHDGLSQRSDTSHVLAALGINTLFSGADAAGMAINLVVEQSTSFLAASAANVAGDGANAGRLAAVGDAPSARAGGVSIMELYNSIAGEVAVSGSAAGERLEAASAVRSALQTQRESVSGVSLDEEAVELLKFERAFQGAARYVGVVDNMLDELFSILL